MSHPILNMPVPILGQSFKVLAAYSTAIIECQCPDKVVMVLTGKGKVGSCSACGKSYGIADSGPMQIGEAMTPQAIDRVIP